MCLASKYLNEINTVFERINRDYNRDYDRLSQELSKYDIMVNEIYHKIESSNFNACEGYYFTKQLQETLRKRRIIKDEMSRLNTIKQVLGIGTITKSITKSRLCITKAKEKSAKWQHNWKHTYTIEEIKEGLNENVGTN